MKMPLTMGIQNVIIATQDYSQYLRSYHIFLLDETDFDWWKETKKFYNTLPLPEGMNTCDACFNAVMHYPIEDTMNTPMPELHEKFTFGY